jgi:2-octaprenyl-6-methoxyphenol hydroxylase
VVRGVVSKRFALDLQLQQASAYSGWRVALVADAAHSVHPMAGQGLNAGIEDVAALVEALDQAASAGLDLGDPQGPLGTYGAERKRANLALMAGIDALHRLFVDQAASARGPVTVAAALPSSLRPPLAALRELGMAALNAAPPLKAAIARAAMGGARGSSPTK